MSLLFPRLLRGAQLQLLQVVLLVVILLLHLLRRQHSFSNTIVWFRRPMRRARQSKN